METAQASGNSELPILTPKKSIQLIEMARRDVHREFFKASAVSVEQGGSSLETALLQISHTETVVSLTQTGINTLRTSGIPVSNQSATFSLLYALMHDVAKISVDRPPEDRLLWHGWDSAKWAADWFSAQLFGPELINKIMIDLQSHMGMPFIQRARESSIHRDEIPQWQEPRSLEAALLFSADLLSPMIFAGPDESHKAAGCLDRYIAINLASKSAQDQENPGQFAFDISKKCIYENVYRLTHPPESNLAQRKTPALVEKTIGESLGGVAIMKLNSLEQYITSAIGWDRITERTDSGSVDHKATLENYYTAVFAWRKTNNLDPDRLENQ